MTYTKINLYLANGIPEALSNLWYGSDSAVVEIRDAVEDAKNGKDLLNRIQKMVNIAYGKETCNPAARFLIAKGNAEVSSLTAGLWEIFSEDAYEKVMQISRRSRMKPPLPRQKRISRWRSPMQRRKPRRLPLPQMHRQRQTANWRKACPIR